MNERIAQLEQKASGPNDPYYRGDSHTVLDTQLFAKLIIQECAGIYEAIDNGNKQHGTRDYLLALKRHFGLNQRET
jgi:hypothetical protein